MPGKSMVVVVALVGLSVIAVLERRPVNGRARGADAPLAADTLTATVEWDSMRVISYLDSAGVEHPVNGTVVPPVPLNGVSEFRVVIPRASAGGTLAGRNDHP